MKVSVNVNATSPLILVLLPVYNGEQFLAEQLNSILSQTHKNIRIMMRDDGSSDHSSAILAEYAARYPQQIQMVRDDLGNLGAAAGFSLLMQLALSAVDALFADLVGVRVKVRTCGDLFLYVVGLLGEVGNVAGVDVRPGHVLRLVSFSAVATRIIVASPAFQVE